MAGNFKYSGARIQIVDASGAISSGAAVVQEGFFGIALVDIASGASGWMACEGVWNITVPATTAKGDFLYTPGADGALTEQVDESNLTKTGSNANSPVAIALTAIDGSNKADVMLLPVGASHAATQV